MQRHAHGHKVELGACSCKAFQASSASASDQKCCVVRASLLRVFTLSIFSAVFVVINVWFARWSPIRLGQPTCQNPGGGVRDWARKRS
jgi:hypothetical protein